MALASCAPITNLAVVTLPLVPSADAAPVAATAPDERIARRAALPRVEGQRCAIVFADAPVILARVGETVITACDVAVAAERDSREGRASRSPREVLNALVAESVIADGARAHGLDRDTTVVRRTRETLAAALVRSEALESLRGDQPDDDSVARYYAAHRSDFTTSERAHLREIVLADETRAREAIRESATTSFEALVRDRSISPDAARDGGDLGLVAREGNDRVTLALAQAGFAIAEPGAVHPEPIRVETIVLEGRRHRPRTVVTWHVIQLLERIPATTLPIEDATRIIRFRLAYGRYEAARIATETRLADEARHARPVEIRASGLRRVHVIAGPPLPRPRRLGRAH
jgi:hypothetical protein